jgi:hypothetical protein
MGGVINFSWVGSTTKETWNRPIRPVQQTGWVSASYGSNALKAQKIMTATPGLSDGESYSGLEDSIDLPSGSPPEELIMFKPPVRLARGEPIYDDESGAVIGFMVHIDTGLNNFYNLNGIFVAGDEIGLEEPLLDPIDFVMIFGGLARGVARAALRTGIRAAASAGSKVIIRALTTTAIAGLRSSFRVFVSGRTLKFTATTAAWMATKGRYVPVHMLKTAIRYGAREADPQGVKGAFRYTLKIIRSDPGIVASDPASSWAGKTYNLVVVVKEELTSNTVLHFLYE